MSKATLKAIELATTTTKLAAHPKYIGSPFEHLTEMHIRTKGKLFEAMVTTILEEEGHTILDATNSDHDIRVQFKGEDIVTKLEIKGSLLRRADDEFYTGQISLAQDFDEVLCLFVYPTKVQGWRINRNVLRNLQNDHYLQPGKGSHLLVELTEEVMTKYNCKRVF